MATPNDLHMFFCWRNDPFIIGPSVSQKTVAWDEHQNWFSKVLASDRHLLFVINSNAGMVRFDRTGDSATVSIYLLKQYTGRGIGPVALKEACRRAFAKWDIQDVRAVIVRGNEASVKAFSKAGFTVDRMGEYIEMKLKGVSGMGVPASVKIKLGRAGHQCAVEFNGVDVSDKLVGIDVHARVGNLTTVTLWITGSAEIEGVAGKVEIVKDIGNGLPEYAVVASDE